jgi:hypothetical protein
VDPGRCLVVRYPSSERNFVPVIAPTATARNIMQQINQTYGQYVDVLAQQDQASDPSLTPKPHCSA